MNNFNPIQEHMNRINSANEVIMHNIAREREEKEAEELRRHNELIEALKAAGENGATIVFGDNAKDIQIQNNSDNSSQKMVVSQEFNYDKVLDVLKEIKEYFDYPQFAASFKGSTDNVKSLVLETMKAVEEKEEPSFIQKHLQILKDLAIGTGGSLIASGILSLLGSIPLL